MADDAQSLAHFIEQAGGERSLRVEENLGEGYVRLRVAEAERRQAKHDIRCIEDVVVEMLRNSRDAGARNIFVATIRDGDLRYLTVLDDGQGIPEDMHDRIFDARVTSKLESVHMDRWGVHGRGMALFSVRENAESAQVMSSAPGKGASIRVVSDATKLSERADQSSWPSVGTNDDGAQSVVRGPHNIARACCEFALEERGRCEVYLGSPAEILSTIRKRMRPDLDSSDLLFIDDIGELPVLERVYVAADASELLKVAKSLGLDISERTAHRIIAGQIHPVRSVYSRLSHHAQAPDGRDVDLERDRRGLKLSERDTQEFQRMMERDFSYLADRYYLSLTDEPRVRVSGSKVTVTFHVASDD